MRCIAYTAGGNLNGESGLVTNGAVVKAFTARLKTISGVGATDTHHPSTTGIEDRNVETVNSRSHSRKPVDL